MINQMVKEHTPGASIAAGVAACLVPLIHHTPLLLLMEESMKGNSRKAKNMVKEHTRIRLEKSMWGNTRMGEDGME